MVPPGPPRIVSAESALVRTRPSSSRRRPAPPWNTYSSAVAEIRSATGPRASLMRPERSSDVRRACGRAQLPPLLAGGHVERYMEPLVRPDAQAGLLVCTQRLECESGSRDHRKVLLSAAHEGGRRQVAQGLLAVPGAGGTRDARAATKTPHGPECGRRSCSAGASARRSRRAPSRVDGLTWKRRSLHPELQPRECEASRRPSIRPGRGTSRGRDARACRDRPHAEQHCPGAPVGRAPPGPRARSPGSAPPTGRDV